MLNVQIAGQIAKFIFLKKTIENSSINDKGDFQFTNIFSFNSDK